MQQRQKTKEQKQIEEVNKVIHEINNIAENMFNGVETIMRLIYQNQEGLTPQDMFDGLGLDGKKSVVLARDVKTLLYKYDANKFPPIQSPFELRELPDKIEVIMPPVLNEEPEEEVTP